MSIICSPKKLGFPIMILALPHSFLSVSIRGIGGVFLPISLREGERVNLRLPSLGSPCTPTTSRDQKKQLPPKWQSAACVHFLYFLRALPMFLALGGGRSAGGNRNRSRAPTPDLGSLVVAATAGATAAAAPRGRWTLSALAKTTGVDLHLQCNETVSAPSDLLRIYVRAKMLPPEA